MIADTELVGVVSRRDIMRSVIRTDDVIRLEVQYLLDTPTPANAAGAPPARP